MQISDNILSYSVSFTPSFVSIENWTIILCFNLMYKMEKSGKGDNENEKHIMQ